VKYLSNNASPYKNDQGPIRTTQRLYEHLIYVKTYVRAHNIQLLYASYVRLWH